MNTADKTFLLDLLATPSPTGFETAGQKKWLQYIKKSVKTTGYDKYGSAWGTVPGPKNAPVFMLESHVDEIGYMVKHITNEGFIHINTIGGSDAATARGRKVHILTKDVPVPGLIGNTAIHIRDWRDEKAPKIHELYIDIGAKDKKEVEKMGIRVGLPIVYAYDPYFLNKDVLVSRALDNRIGGYIVAQVLKRLAKASSLQVTVHGVNAVQEEIGGYGALMVTHRLRPDAAICLDVTHSTDTPGIDKSKFGGTALRAGPTVTHGTCNHPVLVERIMNVAEKKKIPLQHEASSNHSGTDTTAIYRVQEGVPSALVSLPLRYMHSVVEMVSLKDIEHTINLLEAVVLSLKASDSFSVTL